MTYLRFGFYSPLGPVPNLEQELWPLHRFAHCSHAASNCGAVETFGMLLMAALVCTHFFHLHFRVACGIRIVGTVSQVCASTSMSRISLTCLRLLPEFLAAAVGQL